jgi:2'-5' RNA ligase
VRLFLAVDPSVEAVEDLARVVDRLRSPGRSVRPEQFHVTLAFLGEVPEESLDTVAVVVGDAAASAEPGQLRIGGGGRFGTTVLWAGLRGDVDALRGLADSLRSLLRAAGIGLDERPYRPHLTLARPSPRTTTAQLRADVELLARYRGPYWPLDHVYLACSHFPAQARHERLTTWPLGP